MHRFGCHFSALEPHTRGLVCRACTLTVTGVRRKVVAILVESENLRMKACGFREKDYEAVQAKSIELLKSTEITLEEEDTSLINEP